MFLKIYHPVFTICLAIILGCSSSKTISLVSEGQDTEAAKTKRSVFLKESAFYGLQKDHFPQQLAVQLLENQANWVKKCPICDQVKNGFELYVKTKIKSGKTNLPEDTLAQLSSNDETTRKTALRDLIDRYVQQYYSALNMSTAQREHMEQQLSEGRKTGMAVANGGAGFFCSSCDGACHIKN